MCKMPLILWSFPHTAFELIVLMEICTSPPSHPTNLILIYIAAFGPTRINAYYIFIHRYFPCLPPPAETPHEDRYETIGVHSSFANASIMPHWPTSALALAIAAILVLIPPDKRLDTMEEEDVITLRGSFADLYARSALRSLEDSLDTSDHVGMADNPRSALHPAIPRRIEPVLALELLSLYECCQRGNIPRMRIRANQALTTAMDLSLHIGTTTSLYSDAQRRCWWATVCTEFSNIAVF